MFYGWLYYAPRRSRRRHQYYGWLCYALRRSRWRYQHYRMPDADNMPYGERSHRPGMGRQWVIYKPRAESWWSSPFSNHGLTSTPIAAGCEPFPCVSASSLYSSPSAARLSTRSLNGTAFFIACYPHRSPEGVALPTSSVQLWRTAFTSTAQPTSTALLGP